MSGGFYSHQHVYSKDELIFTTSADPATNAAVSTSNIDQYAGVIITLTGAGNAQTLQTPTQTTAGKRFNVVNNDTSTNSITVNSVILDAGQAEEFFWDGTAWITATTSGVVAGVSTSTDNAIARWNGTSGDSIQNSGVIIDDSNNVTGVASLSTTSITNASAITIASIGAGVNITTHTDATDDFTVNTSMLVVEGDTGNVGIGTATPAGLFHVATSTTAVGQGILEQASADTDSFDLNFRKARGTVDSPTVITSGDELGAINFRGYSGAGGYVTGAAIKAFSSGTIATTRVAANLRFYTGTDAAPTVLTERMRIDNTGNVGFNQTSFGTSAVKVLAIGNGTAPTTSPADAVQMWSADRGGNAGKAGLHIRSEDGTSHVFSDLVGIGTVTPETILHVAKAGTMYTTLQTATGYPEVTFRRSNGTLAAPTNVSDGQTIMSLSARPYSGATGFWETVAILAAVDGAVTDNQRPPTRLQFYTNVSNGSQLERMRLTSVGNISVNIATENGNMAGGILMKNGTAASAAVTDGIQIHARDTTDNTSTLALYLEQAVEEIGTFTASHKIKVFINGTAYWLQLDAV